MQEALIRYFAGEKASAWFWGGAGLVAVGLAIAVWRAVPVYRAMAVPLLIFGVIQVGLAAGLALRTDGRVAKMQHQLTADPAAFRSAEITRIRGINTFFKIVECVELALIVTGAALALMNGRGPKPTLFAVGLGLLLAGASMLALDLAAERRSHIYLTALES
jgi:hypothetical protein